MKKQRIHTNLLHDKRGAPRMKHISDRAAQWRYLEVAKKVKSKAIKRVSPKHVKDVESHMKVLKRRGLETHATRREAYAEAEKLRDDLVCRMELEKANAWLGRDVENVHAPFTKEWKELMTDEERVKFWKIAKQLRSGELVDGFTLFRTCKLAGATHVVVPILDFKNETTLCFLKEKE